MKARLHKQVENLIILTSCICQEYQRQISLIYIDHFTLYPKAELLCLFFEGFPGYHTGFVNPGDQRRSAGGSQYYADYANINNQGPRHNRPPDIPQVAHAMQDYADYSGEKNYRVYKFFLTL